MQIGDLGCGIACSDVDVDVVAFDPRMADQWPVVDVVCLTPAAIESLWTRAVGSAVRSFRGVTVERQCWAHAVSLVSRLRQLIQQGTGLVVRLDLPSSRCRVRWRPDHPRFPAGSPLQAYELLSMVHADLAHLALECGRVVAERPTVVSGSAWGLAMTACLDLWRPELALTGTAPTACEVLASTAWGEPVAWVGAQVACLPAWETSAESNWPHELIRAIRAWRGEPASPSVRRSASDAVPIGLSSLGASEREVRHQMAGLERQVADLALLRGDCERLWLDLPGTSEGSAADPLVSASRVLRLDLMVSGSAHPKDNCGADEFDNQAAHQKDQTEAGELTSVRLARLRGQAALDRDVWLVDTAWPGETDALMPAALIVREEELMAAARGLLLSSDRETFQAKLHQALATAQGEFIFRPGDYLLSAAERGALLTELMETS